MYIVYIYAYMYICRCVYIHVCVCTYIHTYKHEWLPAGVMAGGKMNPKEKRMKAWFRLTTSTGIKLLVI